MGKGQKATLFLVLCFARFVLIVLITALRDWDLWGPLLMCFLLAIIVGLSVHNTQNSPGRKSLMFAVVFIIVSAGSLVVTLNAKFLGGRVSIFQAVCVIGYCMFPLVLGALIIKIAAVSGFANILFRGLIVLGTFLWASWASIGFMGALVDGKRKVLAVYPVVLFYIVLGWLILLSVR
jgi:hypothetical protein